MGTAIVPSTAESTRMVEQDPADAAASVPGVRKSMTFTVSSPATNRSSGVSEEGE